MTMRELYTVKTGIGKVPEVYEMTIEEIKKGL